MQLACHLNFFMEVTEAAKVKIVALEEKLDETNGLLNEIEIHACEAIWELREQKERTNTFSQNVVYSVIQLREICQKIVDARNYEAQAIANAKDKVAYLKKKF